MLKMKFRPATIDDIIEMSSQLTVSYVSAYKGLMSEEYLASLSPQHWVPILETSMQNKDHCLIVEENNRIIGSRTFGISHEEESVYAILHAFYCLPEYIGKGIGHSFYQYMEKEMKRLGCTSCILEVLSSNKRAIDFYLSHGFVKISTFKIEENGSKLMCDKMSKAFK